LFGTIQRQCDQIKSRIITAEPSLETHGSAFGFGTIETESTFTCTRNVEPAGECSFLGINADGPNSQAVEETLVIGGHWRQR